MFRTFTRRSGTSRSIWYRRERKRRPVEALLTNGLTPQPRRTPFGTFTPSEGSWLSGDPSIMLRCLHLLATDRGLVFHLPPRAIERKLRLFYCACARRFWDQLPEVYRQAVVVTERYANGMANAQHLRAARQAIQAAQNAARLNRLPRVGGYSAAELDLLQFTGLAIAATEVHRQLHSGSLQADSPVQVAEQAVLLREIFENPFRPVPIAPEWVVPTVATLARVIQTERAFHLMPILGDALQDAGCNHADILEHCYGPGPHAVGCWLVDRLAEWGKCEQTQATVLPSKNRNAASSSV